ncbi:hypothetical protein GCM10023322_25120 [Rugosimonospora acidiphila]|uniref:RNA polymerase sigma factor 70 region 4 type 2 domain-containing protein n=2 Tax=Rugosimonospora acidiphila TaxID=556531 RepID=A0ABP9RRB4_9ACTN
MVTRLALDHLRSAAVRRETYCGPWLAGPVLTADAALGPMETAEQRDSLSTATMRLLEQLTPPERGVFVLRAAFEMPYEDIAEVLDVTAGANVPVADASATAGPGRAALTGTGGPTGPEPTGTEPTGPEPIGPRPIELEPGGPTPGGPGRGRLVAGLRRRWRWLFLTAAVLAAVLTVLPDLRFGDGNAPTTVVHVAVPPLRPASVAIAGYGFEIDGDQLMLWLRVRNSGPRDATLTQPAVESTPGVTLVSEGFTADQDPAGQPAPNREVPAGGLARVVVRYTVDCAEVLRPWPYLGTVSVFVDDDVDGGLSLLTPPTGPARPSPLPCPGTGG